MHANAVAEDMKLLDNRMKHEVDLANVESDENVKNISDIDTEMLSQEEKTAAGLMAITLYVSA